MGLFDVTQAALERALVGSALRHKEIANNIANANTPGFKRSDVDFASVLSTALAAARSPEDIERLTFVPTVDGQSSARADGNNVDIDAEMAALHENALTYQALALVAKARLRMLEIAIGGGRL